MTELCLCCTCYPYQDEEDEETLEGQAFLADDNRAAEGNSAKKNGVYIAPKMHDTEAV
jgi:hypothetical protein